MDTRHRSILKTLSWRVIATIITACIAWIVTENYRFAASISLLDCMAKLMGYYVHERLWNRVSFGRADSLNSRN